MSDLSTSAFGLCIVYCSIILNSNQFDIAVMINNAFGNRRMNTTTLTQFSLSVIQKK